MIYNDILRNQLRSLKQADKMRFVVGNFEYELRAGGSSFCPMFYIGMRKKDSYRGRFTEIGHIDASHLRTKEQVLEKAKEKISEVMG